MRPALYRRRYWMLLGPLMAERREIESLFHLPSPFTRTPPATWHFWKILPPNSVALGLDFWAHRFYALTMQKHDVTMLNYDITMFYDFTKVLNCDITIPPCFTTLHRCEVSMLHCPLTVLECAVIMLNCDNAMINCDTTVWIMIPHGAHVSQKSCTVPSQCLTESS